MALSSIDPAVAAEAFGTIVGTQDPEVFLAVAGSVLARILGFFVVAPFFGSMNIPMNARVGFAVVLTAITVPYVVDPVGGSLMLQLRDGGSLAYLLLLVNQVLIGIMLGFCASFIFYAVESAGRIIDTQRGSNMSDIVAPQTGERTSPSGQFLMMVALMVLLVSGLHMEMVKGLLASFQVFPPTVGLEWLGDPIQASAKHPELEGAIAAFARMSGQSLLLTLQIAAPAMITLMLTDVLLGIINRGAPQVNVFALSQVIKGPIGIAAMMIALLPMWNYLRDDAIPRFYTGSTAESQDEWYSITDMAQIMADSDAAANGRDPHDSPRADTIQAGDEPAGDDDTTAGGR